jgi:hypothetical protein
MTSRVLNIAVRTVHIAVTGVLLGGHAFNIDRERLQFVLWLTIGTGIALSAMEAGPRLLWFHQGRGLLTMAKVGLLFAVPFAWDYRMPILLIVVVIASVGSHMPARYRYYSVLYREVIPDASGPNAGRSRRDAERAKDAD